MHRKNQPADPRGRFAGADTKALANRETVTKPLGEATND